MRRGFSDLVHQFDAAKVAAGVHVRYDQIHPLVSHQFEGFLPAVGRDNSLAESAEGFDKAIGVVLLAIDYYDKTVLAHFGVILAA
jgi:hypothetical protein